MKTRLRNFMNGRNGTDDLSLMMLLSAGVCLVFAALSRRREAAFFFVVLLVILVCWSIFRMLSKNLNARERENRIYKELTGGFSNRSKGFRESMSAWWQNIKSIRPGKNNKTYGLKICLFKCPGCGVNVKVPANKGRVSVTCPRCGKVFERMS